MFMREEETKDYYKQNKFLDYKFGTKPADDTVKVVIDETIKKNYKPKSKTQIEREKKEYYSDSNGLAGESRLSRLGGNSELEKLRRISKLKDAVAEGKVITVTSASLFMGRSRNTVISYAIEGGFLLLDDKTKEWVGGS